MLKKNELSSGKIYKSYLKHNRKHYSDVKPWISNRNKLLTKLLNKNLKERFDVSSIRGGFKGYDQTFVIEINNNNDLNFVKKEVVNYLKTLKDKTLYSLLPVCVYKNDSNSFVYKSIFKESIIIAKDSQSSLISDPLYLAIDYNLYKYGMESIDQVVLFYKIWVKEEDLKVAYNDAVKTLDKVITRRFAENKIVNQIGGSIVEPSKVPKEINNFMDNPLFAPLFNPNLIDYKDINIINNKSIPYFKDYRLIINSIDINLYSCEVLNSDNLIILRFKDSYNPITNTIIRKYNDLVLNFVNCELIHTDVTIRMGELMEVSKDLQFDKNIGTIDLETCPSSDDSELLTVYASAYSVDGETKTYWIGDYHDNGKSLIAQMFNDLFQKRLTYNTFYAHNLGRFDGHFLIKTLLDFGYEVIPTIKDDKTILSLKIRTFVPGSKGGMKKKVTLTLLDSILLLKSSLKQLGKDFNASVLKTEFPHKFATLENLSYIGSTPSINYFNDISDSDYQNLSRGNWSFKDESIKYLTNDVESLRNILLIFGENIYELFNINITHFKTLPAMAFSIFLSNFYKRNDNHINIIKGDVEKNIRSAYHGGLVFVFDNEIKDGYQYDINSHYPNCMKKPMPVGNPTYTDNQNLNEIFGYVRAKVTAPDESVLKNLFLPLKSNDGLICTRGTFYGWWFSEELKNAVNFGYEVSVLGAWTFDKSHHLFDGYVDKLYEIKANSDSKPSQRSTAKLLLNSLYGRMGLNEIDNRVKIIPTAEVDNFLKKVNCKEVIKMGLNSMVIFSGNLDSDLIKLIDTEYLHNDSSFISKRRGVPSSVSIAAAISAYARIEISKYFNIPNNKCIATDTDMIVMEKPLDPSLIGPELGKFKLEYKIDHGIYISPKTYCIKYKNPKKDFKEDFIYRAKGLGGNLMNYQDYLQLLAGFDVIKEKTYFEPVPELGTVRVYTKPFTIKGVNKPFTIKGVNKYLLPAPNYKLLPASEQFIDTLNIKPEGQKEISTISSFPETNTQIQNQINISLFISKTVKREYSLCFNNHKIPLPNNVSYSHHKGFVFSVLNIISCYTTDRNVALVSYLDNIFLKPIKNSESASGKLINKLIITENIYNEIVRLHSFFSKVPDSNFVKMWLKMRLEHDKVIINASFNENMHELLKQIRTLENLTEESMFPITSFNSIKRDTLNYGNGNCLFNFYDVKIDFKSRSTKENSKNTLYACCYIINFKNKYYYYIGSTTNIKERFKAHYYNINKFFNNNNNNNDSLNVLFQYFLSSEFDYYSSNNPYSNTQIQNLLNFNINVLYLSPNYFNLFKIIYPDYCLSKGEWLLLSKITDFIIKTLEENLITEFQPKLNFHKKVVFKHVEWEDNFLYTYSQNNKPYSYPKNKNYKISFLTLDDRDYFSYDFYDISYIDNIVKKINDLNIQPSPHTIEKKSLYTLCKKYNLNKEEILSNLNRFHHYKTETHLRNPLKLTESN